MELAHGPGTFGVFTFHLLTETVCLKNGCRVSHITLYVHSKFAMSTTEASHCTVALKCKITYGSDKRRGGFLVHAFKANIASCFPDLFEMFICPGFYRIGSLIKITEFFRYFPSLQ